MFGGIVETTGIIKEMQIQNGCKSFIISPNMSFDDVVIGDSISVNGVCLTVTSLTHNTFNVTAVPETLNRTNLKKLSVNNQVNLERSLKYGARMGGHYVQGHVDEVATILEINHQGDAWIVKFSVPAHLAKYLVSKGYVGIDGMSITIIEATSGWFSVTFIPHTQQVTIVNQYAVGTDVNLEVDMMAKHIEKLLGGKTYDAAV